MNHGMEYLSFIPEQFTVKAQSAAHQKSPGVPAAQFKPAPSLQTYLLLDHPPS
jgi:hypothetical protein